MNNYITFTMFMATVILLFSCKKDDDGPQLVAHIQFFDNFKDNIVENSLAAVLRIRMDLTITNTEIVNSERYGVLIKSGASDFGINDPASNNTLEGDLGDFYMESK